MLTSKQTQIFGVFLKQPYKELTYREIKDYSEENSNSIIQNAVFKFLEEGLVTKRRIGNIIIYKLDIENTSVFSYFDILAKKQLEKTAKVCLNRIMEEISEVSFVSAVIFGSYAENKYKNKSDLDVALFVNNDKDKRICELAIKSAELKCTIPVDAHVFTEDEMLKMLEDKDENLGKQIAKKHIAAYNSGIFYSIINKGIKNGFKIIY